jgi:hypothetical protein
MVQGCTDTPSGAPAELQELCTPKLISGEWNHRTDWISAFDALALLASSPDSYQNDDLINEIEDKTGLKLPVQPEKVSMRPYLAGCSSKPLNAFQKPAVDNSASSRRSISTAGDTA